MMKGIAYSRNIDERKHELTSLKKEKSADSKGIKAEDLKGADEETTKMIHEIFNLIIKRNSMGKKLWSQ